MKLLFENIIFFSRRVEITNLIYFSQVTFHSNWGEFTMRYVKHYGTWAYILHRLTGLALTGYLLIHIYLISGIHDQATFEREMALIKNPFFSFLEWALFGVLIFHSLNGIRIFIVDYFNGARYHKSLFTASWILSIVLLGAMGFIMFA